MHSISRVIHLIYSVQQLALQDSFSRSPIGVVIAQLVLRGRTEIRLAGRGSLFKKNYYRWCDAVLLPTLSKWVLQREGNISVCLYAAECVSCAWIHE